MEYMTIRVSSAMRTRLRSSELGIRVSRAYTQGQRDDAATGGVIVRFLLSLGLAVMDSKECDGPESDRTTSDEAASNKASL